MSYVMDVLEAIEDRPHMNDSELHPRLARWHESECALCRSVYVLKEVVRQTLDAQGHGISEALGMVRNVDDDAYDNYDEPPGWGEDRVCPEC